ncbi:MAG: PqqD family protein [Phormidesmis sp.]
MYSELADEVAMMDIERGQYYGINTVGARIWLLLETPMSIEAVCQQLVDEYNVPIEVCTEEVLKFVVDLQEHGIVEVVG